MIASLAMYDFGPLVAVNDRFWAGIRAELGLRGMAAPEHLTRDDAAYWPAWTSPDLVLSQTCGFPFRAKLYPRVNLVATPDFGLAGCPAGHYTSVLVARRNDPRTCPADFADARFAFNDDLSQSGWAAAQNHAAGEGFRFQPALRTGAHRQSMSAVADDKADIAAIDAHTWALFARFAPEETDALKIVARTFPPTPALPFITSVDRDPDLIFQALMAAFGRLTDQDRDILGITTFVRLPAQAYLDVPIPDSPKAMGFSG